MEVRPGGKMEIKINAEHELTDKQYRGGFVSADKLSLPDFPFNLEFVDDMTPTPIVFLKEECPIKLKHEEYKNGK